MSLWHDCGAGFVQTSMARQDLGVDVYLCAPGPSLTAIAPGPGIYVAALTKAYPLVRPDIWFGMDEPECYDRRLWWEGFIKVSRANYQHHLCEGRPIKDCPNTFFASNEEMPIAEIFTRRAHDVKFGWFRHTLGVALHVLLWKGARKFRFVGFDMTSREGADYHPSVGLDLKPVLRQRNQKLFNGQVTFMREFTEHAVKHGIELVSCTPGSPLNAFMPYLPLAEALQASRAHVPAAGRMMHCAQVYQAQAAEIIAAGKRKPALPLTAAGIRAAIAQAAAEKKDRGQASPP